MNAELLIDADSHITEPADVWTSRVASKYRDGVPHVVRGDDGFDVWVLDGVVIQTVGKTAPAGWPDFPKSTPQTYGDLLPASYDANARLRYMDEAGIWAQVLYPNVAGFGSQRFLDIADDVLKLLCVQAYNDFLLDWTSADPQRLITICSVPFWDVSATVDEIHRCADLGFRGILFTAEPQRFGLPLLGDTHWDPLWSAACEADLPIHFHIGGGEDAPLSALSTPERLRINGRASTTGWLAVDLFMKNCLQCADLILSGVLNRFPDLKFVSVESGIGWIPFMLEAADYNYLGRLRAGRERTSELLPSELFHRQVYTTYWFEKVAPSELLDHLPVDHILFETDFPHIACLYGNIQETINAGLEGAPDEIRKKFLWDNAAKLYHIRRPKRDVEAN